MSKRQLIRKVIVISLICSIGGPVIGFFLFALIIALYSYNISTLLMVIFLPAYVMAICIGGIPAMLTGICFGILREKVTDKFSVIIITLMVCFLAQSLFILLIMGFDLILMIAMALLGIAAAFIIIFFTGYLKQNTF